MGCMYCAINVLPPHPPLCKLKSISVNVSASVGRNLRKKLDDEAVVEMGDGGHYGILLWKSEWVALTLIVFLDGLGDPLEGSGFKILLRIRGLDSSQRTIVQEFQ